MEIHYLDKTDYSRWNAFVDDSPQATIYGKTWYQDAVQSRFRILTVQEQGIILGGLVMAKNARGWYSNPALCKYLGVYYADFTGQHYQAETKRRRVARRLASELRQYKTFNYLFHPDFGSYLPFYQARFSATVFYSYWLDVQGQSMESIRAGWSGKLRSDIKFAERAGYRIQVDPPFGLFYDLHNKTFFRQGKKSPFGRPWLAHFCEQLRQRDAWHSFVVRDSDDRPMAVVGLIHDQHATSLIINGIDSEKIQRGANEWLIYYCIRFAAERSRWFDFEGSMLEPIDSFYRKFGGQHRPYLKIYRNNLLQFGLEWAQYYRAKWKRSK